MLGFWFDEDVIVGICSSTAFAASPTGPCAIENDSATRTRSTMTLDALLLIEAEEGAMLGSSFTVPTLISLLVWDSFTEQWAH